MKLNEFLRIRNLEEKEIAIIYNSDNIKEMFNEFSSLHYFGIDANFIKKDEIKPYNKIIIANLENEFPNNNSAHFIQIVNNIGQSIHLVNNHLIQYTSTHIKNKYENRFQFLKEYENIVMPCYPEMLWEGELLSTQDNIIFYNGKDEPESMINELMDLDTNDVYYNLKLYGSDFPDGNISTEPSKLHRLSWNIRNDSNARGLITHKVLTELSNGCMPILLKENAPSYLKAYPFFIDLETINNKKLLILRMKEIISFISSIKREEFTILADCTYKLVYYQTHWKKQFYTISEKIKSLQHLKSLV